MSHISDSSTFIILVGQQYKFLQKKCVIFIMTPHHKNRCVFLLLMMAWVKIYILSKKQWPAFKYHIWSCNGCSCYINKLSKDILSNAFGYGLNAMSFYPLLCNKLFQIKHSVQVVVLLRPFLHDYVFTGSSQNFRVGKKKNH